VCTYNFLWRVPVSFFWHFHMLTLSPLAVFHLHQRAVQEKYKNLVETHTEYYFHTFSLFFFGKKTWKRIKNNKIKLFFSLCLLLSANRNEIYDFLEKDRGCLAYRCSCCCWNSRHSWKIIEDFWVIAWELFNCAI
jgi:hypothetical protein